MSDRSDIAVLSTRLFDLLSDKRKKFIDFATLRLRSTSPHWLQLENLRLTFRSMESVEGMTLAMRLSWSTRGWKNRSWAQSSKSDNRGPSRGLPSKCPPHDLAASGGGAPASLVKLVFHPRFPPGPKLKFACYEDLRTVFRPCSFALLYYTFELLGPTRSTPRIPRSICRRGLGIQYSLLKYVIRLYLLMSGPFCGGKEGTLGSPCFTVTHHRK